MAQQDDRSEWAPYNQNAQNSSGSYGAAGRPYYDYGSSASAQDTRAAARVSRQQNGYGGDGYQAGYQDAQQGYGQEGTGRGAPQGSAYAQQGYSQSGATYAGQQGQADRTSAYLAAQAQQAQAGAYDGQRPQQSYSTAVYQAAQAQQQTYGSQQAAYGRSQGAYGTGAHRVVGNVYAAPTPAVQAVRQDGRAPRKSHGALALVVGLVIGLIAGVVATLLVSGALTGAPNPIAGSLTESQLDTVVGTYRYQGSSYEITAREAILGTKSLESVRNSDGTYQAPTADMVVSQARNDILVKLVGDNGIAVSGEEVSAYARELVGSDDMNVVAAYFSMDPDQAQRIMTEAASVRKLREQVVGSAASGVQPPAYPADGATEVGTAAYADYIIGLLGANWNSGTGTWANTDNPYYEALRDQVFAPGSASYDAAQIAYAVAMQQAGGSGGSANSAWVAWLNQYLDEGSIAVATLRA